MTTRIGYTNAHSAARAAFRTITGRLGRGYSPIAYAKESGEGINAGTPVLYVEIDATADTKRKPSDLPSYSFEIRCSTFDVAGEGASILKKLFYGIKDKIKKGKK